MSDDPLKPAKSSSGETFGLDDALKAISALPPAPRKTMGSFRPISASERRRAGLPVNEVKRETV